MNSVPVILDEAYRRPRHRCPRCHALNYIVNQCRCDPDNLPTRVPRDKREVSLGFPPPRRTVSTTLSDAEHARIARRHGGCPITYVTSDGKHRAAIRLPDGEILIDYRSELTYLTACLAESLRIPISARH